MIEAVFIERADMAELAAIGKSTLDRLRATGKIGPRATRLGGSLRWVREEVLSWLVCRKDNGELHDAETWPAIWAELQKRKK